LTCITNHGIDHAGLALCLVTLMVCATVAGITALIVRRPRRG